MLKDLLVTEIFIGKIGEKQLSNFETHMFLSSERFHSIPQSPLTVLIFKI